MDMLMSLAQRPCEFYRHLPGDHSHLFSHALNRGALSGYMGKSQVERKNCGPLSYKPREWRAVQSTCIRQLPLLIRRQDCRGGRESVVDIETHRSYATTPCKRVLLIDS